MLLFILSFLLFVFAMLYLMIWVHNENKNFTVTIIFYQFFQNSWESNSRKYEAAPKDNRSNAHGAQPEIFEGSVNISE